MCMVCVHSGCPVVFCLTEDEPGCIIHVRIRVYQLFRDWHWRQCLGERWQRKKTVISHARGILQAVQARQAKEQNHVMLSQPDPACLSASRLTLCRAGRGGPTSTLSAAGVTPAAAATAAPNGASVCAGGFNAASVPCGAFPLSPPGSGSASRAARSVLGAPAVAVFLTRRGAASGGGEAKRGSVLVLGSGAAVAAVAAAEPEAPPADGAGSAVVSGAAPG